jgi:hypothetical protein
VAKSTRPRLSLTESSASFSIGTAFVRPAQFPGKPKAGQ